MNTQTLRQWTMARKNFQLFIITLAAFVPDFDSGIGMSNVKGFNMCSDALDAGVASIYGLARQYNSTTGQINDLTSK